MEMPYRFVDNPNAPEIFCHHLHDVEFVGGAARFITVIFKKQPDGELLAEQSATIFLPAEAVGPALTLTWQKMPGGMIVPVIGKLVRSSLLH